MLRCPSPLWRLARDTISQHFLDGADEPPIDADEFRVRGQRQRLLLHGRDGPPLQDHPAVGGEEDRFGALLAVLPNQLDAEFQAHRAILFIVTVPLVHAPASWRIICAPFSAIIMVGAAVLPEVIVGITAASTMRRRSRPITLSRSSTTASGSSRRPILAVPTG